MSPPDDAARIIAALQRENARLRAERERERHDPNAFRRHLLRRAWRRYYPGMRRTAAAKAISMDWRAHDSAELRADDGPHLIFDELSRGGVPPLSWSTIERLLDADLYKF